MQSSSPDWKHRNPADFAGRWTLSCLAFVFNKMVSAVWCKYAVASWLLLWTNALGCGGTGKGCMVLLKVKENQKVFIFSFITAFYVHVSPREFMLSKGEIPQYPSYWNHYAPFSYNTENVLSTSQSEMKEYFNKMMTLSVKMSIFSMCST